MDREAQRQLGDWLMTETMMAQLKRIEKLEEMIGLMQEEQLKLVKESETRRVYCGMANRRQEKLAGNLKDLERRITNRQNEGELLKERVDILEEKV